MVTCYDNWLVITPANIGKSGRKPNSKHAEGHLTVITTLLKTGIKDFAIDLSGYKLSATFFNAVAFRSQYLHDLFAEVTLYEDLAVLHGPARAAF